MNIQKQDYEITERNGHHKPNTQRYPDNCGCKPVTDSGYAYRDVVYTAEHSSTEWDKIRTYHQSEIVKKTNDQVKVNTHGYGTHPTTRQRINKELPQGFKLVQRDYEVKLQVPNGDLIKVPRKFLITEKERGTTVHKPNGDTIVDIALKKC